jgi:DnaK suppressor protein
MESEWTLEKNLLARKKRELEESITALSEAHPTPVTSVDANDGDREDVATDFVEIQDEQSLLVNQQALLTQVKNALQRLEDGTYGLCQTCGKPIPRQRLEVIPWADRDVQCEEVLERKNLSREEIYDAPQTF